MIKAKNFFINYNLNNSSDLNKYYLIPRLRRHIYHINQFKAQNIEHKKRFSNLSLSQVNFDLLKIFYIVVSLGSFSKAAKLLSISQPAISLALRKIEKDLGFLVFREFNNKTSILLSPSGLILFNYTQRFFQIIEESQRLSNLNYFQQHLTKFYPIDLKSSNLLPIRKKKKWVFLSSNSPLIQLFVKKHFLAISKFNLLYHENNLKSIILNKKNTLSKIFKLNYKTDLFNIFTFDKIFSFKSLNNNVYITLKHKNFIEIHTINAYLMSLDMKVSNNLYWGSDI